MGRLVEVGSNPFGSPSGNLRPVSGNPFDENSEAAWKEVFVSAVKNIPKSGIQFGKDIFNAVMHPIETGRGLGHLFAGATQKLTPGVQEDEKYADAFVGFMKDRYGSVKGFKETVSKDPVGFVTDLASVVLPAGGAVKAVGVGGKMPVISKAGSSIVSAGKSLDPASIAMRAAAAPVKMLTKSDTASKMYQKGAKFSTTLSSKKRDAITKTALENEIMPTRKGIERTEGMINDLNDQISGLIDRHTRSGTKPMTVDELVNGLDDLKIKALGGGPDARKNAAVINRVKKDIIETNRRIGRTEITPFEAQEIKKEIYRTNSTYYAKQKHRPSKVDADMQVARNTRKYLEGVIPEIKQLNRNDGDLIELLDAIKQPASRIANRNTFGLELPMMATGGGVLGGPKGAAIMAAAAIIDKPLVKTKMAIVLNKLKKKGVDISPYAAAFRLSAAQSGKINRVLEDSQQRH